MGVELCHHVKEDGITCHSPALRGESYCYSHLRYKGRRLRTWSGKRPGKCMVRLPVLDSLEATQLSLRLINEAEADQRLDPGSARLMRYAMRILASNFRFEQSFADSKERKSDAAEQVSWTSASPHDQRGKTPTSLASASESRVCDNSNGSAILRGKSRQLLDSKDRRSGLGGKG